MTTHKPMTPEEIERVWHLWLTTGEMPKYVHRPWFSSNRLKPLFRQMPAEPRCTICYYPFDGMGGTIMRTAFNIKPSKLNPNLCNLCEQFAHEFKGGTEIELTMLFADVRGSTGLAERMNPTEFSRLINRFYKVTTRVLFQHNALVEKMIGDAVTGFFTPGFSKSGHAKSAVVAAREIMRATEQLPNTDPWIPIGIGVHTGEAYVGAVDSEAGEADIVVLGDTANTGARFASAAKAGEILISQATAQQAELDTKELEMRHLELKGRSEPMDVWVLKP
jgi:adenylate cyclase